MDLHASCAFSFRARVKGTFFIEVSKCIYSTKAFKAGNLILRGAADDAFL